jgi:DNA-directed RNA polymerase subunit beta
MLSKRNGFIEHTAKRTWNVDLCHSSLLKRRRRRGMMIAQAKHSNDTLLENYAEDVIARQEGDFPVIEPTE